MREGAGQITDRQPLEAIHGRQVDGLPQDRGPGALTVSMRHSSHARKPSTNDRAHLTSV